MSVFSPFAQAQTVALELTYNTEVIRSDNGTEQRAMNREIPTRRLQFTGKAVSPGAAGWLDSLLYGAFAELMTAPYWPHGSTLTAPAVAGSAAVLLLSTTDRDFEVDGLLVLLNDVGVAEECTVTAVSATSVTVETLALSWPIASRVFPAKRGRYTGPSELSLNSPSANESAVDFLMELDEVPDVAIATSADIFNVVPVDRVEVSHTYERLVDRFANETYSYVDFKHRSTPIGARPYVLWLESRASVTALVNWFHAHRGRLKPFWMPTFQQDFEVLAGLGTASLTVRARGYATWMSDASRKHLAFCEPDGTITNIVVSGAFDNGDGTETVDLSGTAPAGASLVSFMLYGRLASDTLRIEWDNNEIAQCSFGFQELPAELITPPATAGVGRVVFEGFEPTVTTDGAAVFTAETGFAFWEGYAPIVGTDEALAGVGEVTFEGFAPTFDISNAGAIIADTGLALFVGYAPEFAVVAGVGLATFTGYRPRVKTN